MRSVLTCLLCWWTTFACVLPRFLVPYFARVPFHSWAQDAKKFLAHLEKQAARQGGGNASGTGGGKKRGADSSAPRQPPSKAAKTSGGGTASGAAGKASAAARSGGGKPRQASSSPDASRQLSKSISLPAQRQQQQSEQRQQQQAPKASGVAAAASQAAVAVAAASAPLAQAAQQHGQQQQAQQQQQQREELLAMADAGVDPSHPAASGDDTLHLSPTAQVAQSPFRKATLAEAPVAGSGNLPRVKTERASPTPPDAVAATGAGGIAGGDGGGGAATHSPARMSCADASPAAHRQLAVGTTLAGGAPAAAVQQASGAQQGSGAEAQQALPDAITLANDEEGVYHAMSRLLALVASTGGQLGGIGCWRGGNPAVRGGLRCMLVYALHRCQNWTGG